MTLVSSTFIAPSDCPIQSCLLSTYQPDTDYFPVKVQVTKGNFAVNYYNNFKVLSNSYTGEQYVITLCGTPVPVNNSMVAATVSGKNEQIFLTLAPTAKFFTGPITKIAIDETITANVLELLGARSLIAAMDVTYITSPCLHDMFDDQLITSFPASYVDATTRDNIINQMDIVLGGNYANSAPKFIQASITAESSPLGRLEWVKFLGALLNREFAAQSLYDSILLRYNNLKIPANRAATTYSPVVAWINYLPAYPPYTTQNTWTIKNTPYQQVYTQDAGATPFTPDITTYYTAAEAADALVNGNVDIVIDETYIGYYPSATYQDFLDVWGLNGITTKFITNRQVWRNDKMQTATGGDDWFERAIIQIDAVLQDLVSIIHPDIITGKVNRIWFRNFVDNEIQTQTLDRCTDISASLFPILQKSLTRNAQCPAIPSDTIAQ